MILADTKRKLLLGCLIVVAAGLAACRDDALQKEFINEKGVYEGPSDTPLTEQQQRALDQRARQQSF